MASTLIVGKTTTGKEVTCAVNAAGELIVEGGVGGGGSDATAANQTAGNATLVAIDGHVDALEALTGATNETAPASDTATSGNNGRLQRIAQRITSLIALLPASLGAKTAANSLAVTTATDDVVIALNGAVNETAPASDTASSGQNGRLQRVAQNLTTLNTSTGTTNTSVGATNETAPASDTATSGLNGRLQRIAQRVTSLIALLPASLGGKAAASSLAVTTATDDPPLALLGAVNETAPASDTASSGHNGRLQRIAQNQTSTNTKIDSTNAKLDTLHVDTAALLVTGTPYNIVFKPAVQTAMNQSNDAEFVTDATGWVGFLVYVGGISAANTAMLGLAWSTTVNDEGAVLAAVASLTTLTSGLIDLPTGSPVQNALALPIAPSALPVFQYNINSATPIKTIGFGVSGAGGVSGLRVSVILLKAP